MFRKTIQLLLLASPYFLDAQPDSIPAKTYLEANNIKALINANGLLFYDFELGGQFLPDSTDRSPIKAAGLWMGGFDYAGNLKMAVQLYNENGKQDFLPGFSEGASGNWNSIWKINRKDISKHVKDYWSDRILDDTLSSVFGWPANGNKHFEKYNGLELPDEYFLLQNFNDENESGVFDPENGDFPASPRFSCDLWVADETAWNVYHANTTHTESAGSSPLNVTVDQTSFGFNCPDNRYLSNTIFVRYLISNYEPEPIDSFFVSLFVDFELGCPNDDYLATIPSNYAAGHTVFAYNSDNIDEDCGEYIGFGEYPPIVACKVMRGPMNEFREESPVNSIMPLPFGDLKPENAQEFYNVMSGHWADGTPLTYGGNGYNPQSTQFTKYIYPGRILEVDEWNESSVGNAPGKRRAIISFDDFRLDPGSINQVIAAFTFFPNGEYPIQNRLFEIYNNYEEAISLIYNCDAFTTYTCTQSPSLFPDSGFNSPLSSSEETPFKIFPNPATDEVSIQLLQQEIATSLEIYDATMRLVYEKNQFGGTLSVSTLNWPNGTYFVVTRADHETYIEPFIIVGH